MQTMIHIISRTFVIKLAHDDEEQVPPTSTIVMRMPMYLELESGGYVRENKHD